MWECWALCPDLQEIVSGINGGKRGIEGKCGIGEKCITTVTLLKWFNIKPFKHTTLSMQLGYLLIPSTRPIYHTRPKLYPSEMTGNQIMGAES